MHVVGHLAVDRDKRSKFRGMTLRIHFVYGIDEGLLLGSC